MHGCLARGSRDRGRAQRDKHSRSARGVDAPGDDVEPAEERHILDRGVVQVERFRFAYGHIVRSSEDPSGMMTAEMMHP